MNNFKPEDFLIFITELLNIKTESNFTIADMTNDIASIYPDDLPKFKHFVETQMRNEKYNFTYPLQKFKALRQDFEYYNRPRLSQKSYEKVETYATYLFKKTCYLFDRITWQLETQGKSIDEVSLEKTKHGDKPYFTESDLKYLYKVGTKQEIYNLVKRSKSKLESEILKVVTVETLIKHDPRNQIANQSQDKKALNQIKKRSA